MYFDELIKNSTFAGANNRSHLVIISSTVSSLIL